MQSVIIEVYEWKKGAARPHKDGSLGRLVMTHGGQAPMPGDVLWLNEAGHQPLHATGFKVIDRELRWAMTTPTEPAAWVTMSINVRRFDDDEDLNACPL